MSDKVYVEGGKDLPEAIANIKIWMKKSFKDNRKWLITYFTCITFGYLGIHELVNKKIGRFILYLLTFGIFGFGVLADVLALLWNRTAFKHKGYPEIKYPHVVRIIFFGLYLCIFELILILIFNKLGLKFPDFTVLTWESALQRIEDFIGGARY